MATVAPGYKTQTQLQRLNGQDAVGLQIVKQSDANALQVADDVRVALAKLQKLLPADSQVVVTNDTSVFTRASLDAIQHDLLKRRGLKTPRIMAEQMIGSVRDHGNPTGRGDTEPHQLRGRIM